jgi:hypothetical protein
MAPEAGLRSNAVLCARVHTPAARRRPRGRGFAVVAYVLGSGLGAVIWPLTAVCQESAGVRAMEAVDDGASSPDADRSQIIQLDGDRLTARVADMPLRNFLLEVGRLAGAEVRIDGLEERTVSVSFSRLALEEALRRVLGGRNFTLTYYYGEPRADQRGSALRLKALHVYGSTGAVVTAAPPAARVADTPTAAGTSVGIAPPSARSRTVGAPRGRRGPPSAERAAGEAPPAADPGEQEEPQPPVAAGAVPAVAPAAQDDAHDQENARDFQQDGVAGPGFAYPAGIVPQAEEAGGEEEPPAEHDGTWSDGADQAYEDVENGMEDGDLIP